MYPNGHSSFSETETKKLDFNTSLTLFSEIEIKKLEVNNSLILILQKWSKSRRKLFTQTCLKNYQVVGVKTLLFIVLTWLGWNLAKWKKEIHAFSEIQKFKPQSNPLTKHTDKAVGKIELLRSFF